MAFDDRDTPAPDRRVTLTLLIVLLSEVILVFSADYFASVYASIAAFFMIPAAIGGLFSQLSDPFGRQAPMGCFVFPTLALLAIVAVAWLVFGEGVICIAMVLPLWVPAAVVGAVVNRYNARRNRRFNDLSRMNSVAWLALPLLLITTEAAVPPDWQHRSVVREIVIEAGPDDVWPFLLSVPNISEHEGRTNFTQDILGVPKPTNATLVMRQGTLVRIAHWGTDLSFEEVVTENKPGKRLGWRFVFPDESVQHHTDRHISPDGPLLKIESGRYDLQALDNGGARLRLTTTYRMKTRLSAYLGWWGERLLGDVENNVLTVIKDRAEGRESKAASGSSAI